MITLDLIQTIALAALVLFVGRAGVRDRYNIPAPPSPAQLEAAMADSLRVK